jgi:hypothetical protein
MEKAVESYLLEFMIPPLELSILFDDISCVFGELRGFWL